MAASVAELCDEIAAVLNAGTFSQAFTAERSNVWVDDLKAATGIQCQVIPVEVELTAMTRDSIQRKFRVNIVLQKKVSTQTTATSEQDEMLELAEEIEDYLYGADVGRFSFVEFNDGVGARSLIDMESMATTRVFRTVLQVSYIGF